MSVDEVSRSSGTTLDVVRRQNLTQVLRLTHRDGPISRAELTRATGLNRSTVGGLVAELRARGLVEESDPHPTRKVGRPSPMVAPADDTVAIAVNPEIDAVDVGIVSLGGRVIRHVRYKNERIPTPTEFVNIVAAIIGGMRPELEASYRTLGMGLAVPGLVRARGRPRAARPAPRLARCAGERDARRGDRHDGGRRQRRELRRDRRERVRARRAAWMPWSTSTAARAASAGASPRAACC